VKNITGFFNLIIPQLAVRPALSSGHSRIDTKGLPDFSGFALLLVRLTLELALRRHRL